MTIARPRAALCAALMLTLAACAEQPLQVTAPGDPAVTLAALRCTADARAQTLTCETALPAGASRTLLTYGGQHRYVRVTSEATVYDAGTDTLYSGVSVQNLLLVSLATADGVTADPTGVRVFFSEGPSNGVVVGNPAGIGTFTAAGQPYYSYSGIQLGGDGMLAPGEVSASQLWRFAMNGASTFTFLVFVQTQVPTGAAYSEHFTQLALGGDHSCALTGAGTAYCWGMGTNGQLGNGLGDERSVATRVTMPGGVAFTALELGFRHSCAVGGDGKGYCWGSDSDGQLGNGGGVTADQMVPGQVSLPGGAQVTAITAGEKHTCALGSDLKAYCWGSDALGSLGNGPGVTGNQASPTEVVLPGGVTFTSISAGEWHTCARGSNGRAYCWGWDAQGQVGNGAASSADVPQPAEVTLPVGVTVSSVVSGGRHSCAIGTNAKVYCWGSDVGGQLGNGGITGNQSDPTEVVLPGGVTFSGMTGGSVHHCALGSDSRSYCWGVDALRQLGNGEEGNADQPAPVLVSLPSGVTATSLAAGDFHTCAVTGTVSYCWGSNLNHQLGDGSWLDRAAPVMVAGTR